MNPIYIYKKRKIERNKTMNYYNYTIKEDNRVNVISLNEYHAQLFKDEPRAKNGIDWEDLKKNNSNYNACYLCNFNSWLSHYNESLHYVEGTKVKDGLATHYAWIYSEKYDVYVDVTGTTEDSTYYISDERAGKHLKNWLADKYDMFSKFKPTWINEDVPTAQNV